MNHSGLVDLVHITNPEDLGSGLPPSTSEDAGKVLKVASDGVPGWGEDAMATVDQNYDATSTHAQSGLAVAQALSDVKEVPAVGSSDGNKVLKATYSGGVGSYSWEDAPASVTVDQSYSASSTNPQSGTAVAEAISGVNQVPASTSADENKVLKVNAQGNPEWATASGGGGSSDTFIVEDSTTLGDVYAAYTSGKVLYYKASSGEMYYLSRDLSSGGSSYSFNLAGTYTVIQWADSARIKTFTVSIALDGDQPLHPTTAFGDCILNTYTVDTQAPLPSKTGNAGKILAVNSSATGLEWVAKPTSVTYTAGDGIDITSDVVSAKAGNGLSIGTSTKTGLVTEPKYAEAYAVDSRYEVICAIPLTSDIVTAIDNNETITVVVPQYVDPTVTTAPWFQNTNRYVIGAHNNASGNRAPLSAPSASYYGTFTLNKSNIPSDYLTKWDNVKASNTTVLEVMGCTSTSFNGWPGYATVSDFGDYKVFDMTMSKTTTIQNAINVDNPLPATLGTAGQVLAVNSGATGVEWINNVPIEVVASMPANPTAGVLYIVTGA